MTLKLKFSSTYFKRAPEQSMQAIMSKKKKMKGKKSKKQAAKKILKKSHSLTDLRNMTTNKIKPKLEVPINYLKDEAKNEKDKLFIKQTYASINKEEKNLTVQSQQNQLFTTQEVFLTENHLGTENEPIQEKKEFIQERKPTFPKKDQLEIIIFEEENDVQQTSNRNANVINKFDEEKTAKTYVEVKEKKLQKDNFNNDPIYLNKSNFQEYSKADIDDIRFQSLQFLDSKNNQNFDIISSKNNELSSPSERVEKSLVNCLICFDKIPDSVFMECGHGGNYI